MADQKVINHILKIKGSCNCYICGAKPKQMNNLVKAKKRVVNEKAYRFGISTLHAKINTFECLLHIAYKLDVKQWRSDKIVAPEILKRKKLIQERFAKEMSLNVDLPIGTSGNTNDGNTARKFFDNPELSADITGIDVNLIKQFHKILSALSSGQAIDLVKYEKLCDDTAELYVKLYNWYYMPVTVHKILLHSVEVIKYFILPIGLYSEDAQETRTKDLRRFRLDHTRKSGRKFSNMDLLRRLILSSDPNIRFLGGGRSKKAIIRDQSVLELLVIDPLNLEESEEENDSDDPDCVNYD